VNTTTLHHSTPHPPDTEDRQVLEILAPAERRRLALADRISLQIGLWLLLRAQSAGRRPVRRIEKAESASRLTAGRRGFTEREAITLLTYDLHRQLR
jgi:hypothetical protein